MAPINLKTSLETLAGLIVCLGAKQIAKTPIPVISLKGDIIEPRLVLHGNAISGISLSRRINEPREVPLKGLQTSGTNEKFPTELLGILPQTDQLNQLYFRDQICRVTRRAPCKSRQNPLSASHPRLGVNGAGFGLWRGPRFATVQKRGRDRAATEISFSIAGSQVLRLEGSEAGIASMLQGGPSNRGTLMLVDFTTKSSATAYTSYIKVQLLLQFQCHLQVDLDLRSHPVELVLISPLFFPTFLLRSMQTCFFRCSLHISWECSISCLNLNASAA